MRDPQTIYGTTIICVRKGNSTAIAGDGQITLGNTIMKGNAVKVRRLYNNRIVSGFAGAVADAITLFERIEKKLEEHDGSLMRACVEVAKDWRLDKYLRRLEAMLIVADHKSTFLISGSGEVIEPEDRVTAIGSGGEFARSAALALCENTKLNALDIACKSLQVAAKICIYTNHNINVEEINAPKKSKK